MINTLNPSHMHVPLEVKVWHRASGVDPQLTLMVNTETVIRLSPAEAEQLADRLRWHAQYCVNAVKRARGADIPYRHLRYSEAPCPGTMPGDITFRVGVVYDPATLGQAYHHCELCHPEMATR